MQNKFATRLVDTDFYFDTECPSTMQMSLRKWRERDRKKTPELASDASMQDYFLPFAKKKKELRVSHPATTAGPAV